MPDFDALARLHAACFETPRPWSAAELQGLSASSGAFLLHQTQGFLLGRAIAGEAELLTLAVNPEARRQGIGNKLVSQFLAKSRQLGCDSAFLEVSVENEAALALYDSAGFRKAGRRRGYYHAPDGRAIDALILTISFCA